MRRKPSLNQRGQTMTEYIILVAILAVGSIIAITALGGSVQEQVRASANRIAGQAGDSNAKEQANRAKGHSGKGMADFWRQQKQ